MADPFGNVVDELSTLFRKEVQLARAEVGEKVGQATGAAASLAVGGVLLLAALIFLLQAAVTFLVYLGVPVGVALGAALGALLPGTQAEDRLMGEASDSLTQQAKAAAQGGYQRVQEVAGEQLDRAKGAAAGAYHSTKGQVDQSGLSPGKIGDAVGSVAQQVRQAVREGTQAVAGETREALNKADPAKGTNT